MKRKLKITVFVDAEDVKVLRDLAREQGEGLQTFLAAETEAMLLVLILGQTHSRWISWLSAKVEDESLEEGK
jgi:hypothetical protein